MVTFECIVKNSYSACADQQSGTNFHRIREALTLGNRRHHAYTHCERLSPTYYSHIDPRGCMADIGYSGRFTPRRKPVNCMSWRRAGKVRRLRDISRTGGWIRIQSPIPVLTGPGIFVLEVTVTLSPFAQTSSFILRSLFSFLWFFFFYSVWFTVFYTTV